MARVGIRELSENTSDVIRRVRINQETIEITLRGEVVAQIQPKISPPQLSEIEERLAKRKELARQISRDWQEGVSAVDAVAEQRRDL